jgi:tubulin monoglycylase TTLL3/8
MVDENLDVWLIEVNSSPAMDYSTDITERLVTRVLPDCVKVLADYEYSGKKEKA